MRPEIREKGFMLLVWTTLGLWVLACAWFPLTDSDIWWHLASAKLMWARQAFLRADPFCLVSLGAPWIDLHWGFQVLAYAAWKWGGAHALVAGKALALMGAVFLVLLPNMERRTAYALAPLAAFGCYHIRLWVDVRPLALTLLGLSLQYAVVMAYLQGRLRRPWAFLIPIQVVLVNLQGLYPLGAVLVTCLTLGERLTPFGSPSPAESTRRWKTLAWASLAMWLAGFINPYGWQGFRLPLALLGRIAPLPGNIFSSEIAENQPIFFLFRQDPRALAPFVLFFVAVLFTFDRARRRTDAGHALVFVAFAVLGLMAQRNLPLAFLAGLMAAGRNLQVSLEWAPRTRLPWRMAGWVALAVIPLFYGPRLYAAWDYELDNSMETPFRFPSGAVAYLQAHPLPGNIFNELRFGGYLTYRLYPSKLSFVDGRMIVRGEAFYREFLDIIDRPSGFPEYRLQYGITHVLLPIGEDKRFVPLLGYLLRRGDWKLLHCDGASALLAEAGLVKSLELSLDSLPFGHPVREALRIRFASNPRLETLATLNLSGLLLEAGQSRAALDLRGKP